MLPKSSNLNTDADVALLTTVNNSGRLKYADPRTLPSFPSSGLKPDGAAAGAAATLGWQSQKTVELWKPDKLSSASAAAVLAKDYKMAPQWQPTSDSAGHKAALLAVGSANSALKHQRSSSSKSQHEGWGNSAATQAFHASRPTSVQPNDLSHGNTAATQAFNTSRSMSVRNSATTSPPPAQGDRSLLAAKGAMASSRPRATSVPVAPQPSESRLDSQAASSALNGAAIAHRASMQVKPPSEDAGAVPVTTMTRNMFTSRPLVKPEVDERQNNERLHQSAVEMAKKMYNQQQKMVEQARAQGEDPDKMNMPALNLQDAAYKQAQDRLSKLQDEHLQSRDMQEYYGNAQAPRRRWTVANKLRRKNSDEDFDDQEESAKIRQQMSMFSKQLTEVDQTKRQKDRDNLLAAAQRNVKARLHGMDEKVYSDTGKVNPTLLSDWEVKAQQAAQVRHDARGEHTGKLNLGGGMYMDQDAIDAIAAKRMQPVLDDINEKAEKERERLAALKLEEESKKAEMEREREREREMKNLQKQVRGKWRHTVSGMLVTDIITDEDKQDQKARRMQEKEEEKARKEREKAEKAEQKKMAKEEKRKSKHDSGVIADDRAREEQEIHREDEPTATSAVAPALERYSFEDEGREPARASTEVPHTTTTVAAGAPVSDTAAQPQDDDAQSPKDPSSPGSKVKGWFRNRLSRGKSLREKHNKGDDAHEDEQPAKEEKRSRRKSLFGRGGGALRKNKHQNASTTSIENRQSSMRDVAMAGKASEDPRIETNAGTAGEAARQDSRGVSPVSSIADEEETRSRRDRDSDMNMLAPRPIGDYPARSSISPNRDSRFREEMDP